MVAPIGCGVLCAVCFFVSFCRSAAILLVRRNSWRLLYFNCFVAVCVLCLFLTVPGVGLWSMIVAVPGRTQL